MGTRGLVGLVIGDELKASYNHSDSYPSGLGVDVVKFVKGADLDTVKVQARALTLVRDDDTVNAEQANALGVPVGAEWYDALRDHQGNLGALLEAGYMTDERNFAADSLFCEWGYIVNLDTSEVEVYRGFQREEHTDGRFADLEQTTNYYPIRLIKTIPFSDLSVEAMTKIEEDIYAEEE